MSQGTLTVIGSTISDNAANTGGGGAVISGSAAFVNTTISGNTTASNGLGGGIYVSSGTTVTLANVTLSSNRGGIGGNLLNGGTTLAKNTIIASGFGRSDSNNCSGPITSEGYNIEDLNQCGLAGTGDQTNTDPMLGALQNNGGPTDTQAPALDSAAVDHGNPAGCTDASNTSLTVDQRGMTRPQGMACDVGAYELQPVAPTASASPTSGVGPREATLNGSVDTHGFPTSWHFEYGLTTAYGSSTPVATGAGGTQAAGATITGLLPDTTYHFKLVASTSAGESESADQVFTTAPDAPDVATGPANGLAMTTATLNGTVTPNGLHTTYQFHYGTTSAYGVSIPTQAAGNGTSGVGASATITGLAPGTTYHYVLVAINGQGSRIGADQTFTTPPRPGGLQLPPALGAMAVTPSALHAAGRASPRPVERGRRSPTPTAARRPPPHCAAGSAGNLPTRTMHSAAQAEPPQAPTRVHTLCPRRRVCPQRRPRP